MKWAMTGLTVKAVVQSVTAYADPASSDLWFGPIFTETEGLFAEVASDTYVVVEQSVRKD